MDFFKDYALFIICDTPQMIFTQMPRMEEQKCMPSYYVRWIDNELN
jgi:hypothetical protein